MGRDGRLESLAVASSSWRKLTNDRPVGVIQLLGTAGVRDEFDGNEISIPKGYTGTAFWGDTVMDWVRRGRCHTLGCLNRRTCPPTIRRRHRARPIMRSAIHRINACMPTFSSAPITRRR